MNNYAQHLQRNNVKFGGYNGNWQFVPPYIQPYGLWRGRNGVQGKNAVNDVKNIVTEDAFYVKNSCLYLDGVNDYVEINNTGIGENDFYYEWSGTILSSGGYVFSDGNSDKYAAVKLVDTSTLLFEIRDELSENFTNLVITYNHEDECVIKFYRLGNTVYCGFTDLVNGINHQTTFTSSKDFSSENDFHLGNIYDGTIFSDYSNQINSLLIMGETAENPSYIYYFGEGAGKNIYDVMSGNHGKINSINYLTSWSYTQDFYPNNIKNGFNKYSFFNGVDNFISYDHEELQEYSEGEVVILKISVQLEKYNSGEIQTILSKGGQYSIQFTPSGNLQFTIPNVADAPIDTALSFEDGVAYSISIIYDTTTNLVYYASNWVDGDEVSFSDSPTNILQHPLYFASNGTNNYTTGIISDFQMYVDSEEKLVINGYGREKWYNPTILSSSDIFIPKKYLDERNDVNGIRLRNLPDKFHNGAESLITLKGYDVVDGLTLNDGSEYIEVFFKFDTVENNKGKWISDSGDIILSWDGINKWQIIDSGVEKYEIISPTDFPPFAGWVAVNGTGLVKVIYDQVWVDKYYNFSELSYYEIVSIFNTGNGAFGNWFKKIDNYIFSECSKYTWEFHNTLTNIPIDRLTRYFKSNESVLQTEGYLSDSKSTIYMMSYDSYYG